ncbi:MAG: aminotransferase class I/II-fold pyridoxal phosphate-dependent enzyme [Crocinitomicaceae bacterium]|nr:aminotransferase class I/II-fold pyridoxal phosphate-dependent enzyme [Crocinitomicaceae bacterium]MCF8433231.1 aminotransferase class I/II-fold pyridoxal phosphate-dependent enzyme [Crocinitomicaceae bacterium]
MSKLPHIGTTIFTIMSQLANEHGAINLSQGFPNFPVDTQLTDILKNIASDNVHQYAPMGGYPPLQIKIAELVNRQYHRIIHPSDEVLITAGATQAIFAIIQAMVNTNEEVVILDPSYDCYEPPIILTGAKPVRIQLDGSFMPDWQRINDAVNERTRMIIINNPHNPSGRIWTENDFLQLEILLDKYPQLLVLSDEVYEYITFELKHISVNTREKIRSRSIIVSSFGKTFHITGWKVGYIVAPIALMIEIKKVHQFLVFCVNSVAQVALSQYLDKVDVAQLGAFYQDKRDLFRRLISTSRFELLPSEGSYFQVASYAHISDESDVEFTKRLVIEHGVASIPMSVFNASGKDQKLIRFCFAKDTETLTNAAKRLCEI